MKSRKRLEMGEEAWAEYQKERVREKSRRYLKNHPEAAKRQRSYSTYWRIRAKQTLIDYKGGHCEVCGYNKDSPSAYSFHHIDPKEKDFSISQWKKLNMKLLKKEVDKCRLLCCRCHAELHDEERKDIRMEAFASHDRWTDSECHRESVMKRWDKDN